MLLDRLVESARDLARDADGRAALKAVTETLKDRSDQDAFRAPWHRWLGAVRASGFREQMVAGVAAGSVTAADSAWFLGLDSPEGVAAVVLAATESPALRDLAGYALMLRRTEHTPILAAARRDPGRAVRAVATLADAIDEPTLARFATEAVPAAPSEAAAELFRPLHQRLAAWTPELIAAALAHPLVDIAAMGIGRARDSDNQAVPAALRDFFTGHSGGPFSRREFQRLTSIWAGAGAGRRGQLRALAWFLLREARGATVRRALWVGLMILKEGWARGR